MKNYIGKDFYKLLGISPESDTNEIKSAYRKLAKLYHPDTNKGNKVSEQKFKELTEAYDILCDEKKRTKYDIANGFFKKNNFKNASNQAKAQAKQAYEKEKEIVEGKGAKPFSDILDGLWKKNSSEEKKSAPKKSPKRGNDITLDVELTPEEALKGVVKQVNIMYVNACKCGGKEGTNCSLCRGTNDVPKQEKVSVKIPAGVKEGTKVRIKNEGNRGRDGGANGDLILIVKMKKSEKFVYNGNDILYELPVTPSEAALGATINIPVVDGNIIIKIPPETSSGQKLKMAGQGKKGSDGKKGDFIVTVKIQMPKKLSPKEKQLYKELSEQRTFNPREKKNA